MPIWSETELRTLIEIRKNGPLIEKGNQELLLRICRFGAIPQYVAHPTHDHDKMIQNSERAVADALDRLEVGEMKEMLDPCGAYPEHSGRIMHLIPEKSLSNYSRTLASEAIEREILMRCQQNSRQDLIAIIKTLSSAELFNHDSELANKLSHATIQAGGKFQLVQLFASCIGYSNHAPSTRDPARDVDIPTMAPHYSIRQDVSDLVTLWDPKAGEVGLYIHLLSRDTPSIDSIIVLPGETGESIFSLERSRAASPYSSTERTHAVLDVKELPETPSSPRNYGLPPCVVLTHMTMNTKHCSSDWNGFMKLVDSVRSRTPNGTSIHLCWVMPKSEVSGFRLELPLDCESFIIQIPQWLLTIPDNALTCPIDASVTLSYGSFMYS